MLTEKQIVEKGYEIVGDNLYSKNGELYVQHMGELKLASFCDDKTLNDISDLEAYKALTKGKDTPKKKEEKKTPQEKQPSNPASIIVRDENQAHDFMNIKDDQQVLEEMQGKYLEEFVYSFEIDTAGGKKKTVTGLSWAGVKEVVRSAGNIEVEDLKTMETDKFFRVEAKARDTLRNIAMFGIAEQSKKMKLKDGKEVEDAHALSKCVSRAQRNALRVLIPEATIKNTIEIYLKEKGKK